MNPLKERPTGGPSSYYDMPYKDWVTTNDQMEYLAENKWGKYSIHLKDIFKGLCRWGDKDGTDHLYDTKKIIYYGVRVLKMIIGTQETRAYLQSLLNDKQFMENKTNTHLDCDSNDSQWPYWSSMGGSFPESGDVLSFPREGDSNSS